MPHPPLTARIARIRALYSAIGEPLPAPIITDLYRILPKIPLPRQKILRNHYKFPKSPHNS